MKTQLDKMRRDGWCGIEAAGHSIFQHGPLQEGTASMQAPMGPEAPSISVLDKQ